MGRISVVAWRLRGARRFEEASHGDCRELQRRSLARLRMAPPPASDGVRVRAAPYTSLRRNAVIARERPVTELLMVCEAVTRTDQGRRSLSANTPRFA
jgi:hypothetical protein